MMKKILIIDDEPVVLENVRFILEKNNYQVITASAGIEGISKAVKEKPKLILLDILLPDIEGSVVADKLQSTPETREIPILFLTCLIQENEMKGRLQLGGNIFIPKPFKPEELLAKVRFMIGK